VASVIALSDSMRGSVGASDEDEGVDAGIRVSFSA
jgi:hypothetical protein